jgi:hypothetical protein
MVSKTKAAGPDDVEPVTVGKIRYEAPHWGRVQGWGQNGGHIIAVDVASGAALWRTEIYKIDSKPNMGADKQDSFITSLEFEPAHARLVAENDRGRRFALDLFSREVTAL